MNNRLLHEHDFRAQFALRWADYQRANSPRQRRLAAQRQFLIARYHQNFSTIAGGILLVVIIICLFFI